MTIFGVNKLAFVFALLITLSACGGGGGGGGSSASTATNWTTTKCTSSYTNSDGIKVPCAYQTFNTTQNSTTGSYSASTYDVDTYGVISSGVIAEQNILYTRSWSRDTNYDVLASTATGPTDLPYVWLTDTSAATAWAAGWTGTGTTINIIDDSNTTMAKARISTYSTETLKMRDSGGDTGTYTAAGYLQYTLTHGNVVRDIAGGDKRAVTDYTGSLEITSASITACVNSSNQSLSTWNCPSTGYLTGNSYEDISISTSIMQTPGVAKNASMTTSTLNLSGYTNPATTWTYLKGFIENSASFNVVNLSIGAEASSSTTWATLVSLKENFSLNTSPSGTYVVAAGNSSAPCTASNFTNCNIISGMMTLSPYLRNQVIVAGATKTISGTNTIATYSNQAGVMMDRYLMAEGDTGFDSSSGDIEGTSFAAPRIAGAAAIVKSKFPNLTGANVADILLLTADKDINDDGNDDFSSVSAIYGRGELDLSAALSPVGNLTP